MFRLESGDNRSARSDLMSRIFSKALGGNSGIFAWQMFCNKTRFSSP
jgi:hypothetical protein